MLDLSYLEPARQERFQRLEKRADYAVCHTCRLKHPLMVPPELLLTAFGDFAERHPAHRLSLIPGEIHQARGLSRWARLRELILPTRPRWLAYAPNADRKLALASSGSWTITLNSLASSATAGRESTAFDNSSLLYLDLLCTVQVTLQAGSPANDKAVYVYAYHSEDGSVYDDNVTGSDAAVTLRDPTCLRIVSVIPTPDSGGVQYERTLGIAPSLGGLLGRKVGIVVRNYTGVALHASAGNAATRSGVYETVI